ncbi:hypothetical protein AB0L65_33025 [Nonomuraea sp. NPDC052116]|uniref:chromo domain-containing protein n=1 Tax=Nonomuraea sp. NPDC052116 TaxID=3155665 RepID=UPI0034442BE8
MQDLPPSIKLPGHEPDAGLLHAWRKTDDGSKEYLVEWVPILPGYRGGLGKPEMTWFPADQVEQIKGEDYSQVPRIRA